MNTLSLPQRTGTGKPAALAALALLVVAACGRAPEPARAELRPGDSLLERLDAARVAELAATCLPDADRARLRPALDGRGLGASPDAWEHTGTAPVTAAHRRFFAGADTLERWRVRPEVPLESALGEPWLEHRGERLERRVGNDGSNLWFDAEALVLFGTRSGGRTLQAFGLEPPGALRYGYDARAGAALRAWEPSLFAESPPADARALRGRVTLGHVDRDGLRVRTPSRLEWAFDGHAVQALEVSVGVPEVRVGEAPANGSDGVTFVVELERDGVVQRLWSRHVSPGEGYVTQRVELGAWPDAPGVLRLVTEGGPGGDTRADHAVWSGLRARGVPARAPTRPHLVLIDVDTLRADRMGCYGHARPTTPRLDAWAAAQARVFDDALASADWTLPSTASMLTGLTVPQHGVTGLSTKLGPSLGSVALRLAEAGYETWARTDAGLLSPAFGFAHGFDVFEAQRLPRPEHRARGWLPELERLRTRESERPSFTFLQTYMTHDPFVDDRRFEDASRAYRGPLAERDVVRRHVLERLEQLDGRIDPADERYLDDIYDAGVRRMDDLVADFLDGLPVAFGEQPYLVLLTSDHGEEILEHGGFGHGHSLHREVLRVPLILRAPDGSARGRSAAPVSLVDVVPTLLDAAGLPTPPELAGLSLLGELPSRRARVAQHLSDGHPEPSYALSYLGHTWIEGTIVRADGSRFEHADLFEPAHDPFEQRDLAAERPERAAQLAELLRAELAERGRVEHQAEGAELDAERLADLKALGYVQDG